jgi:hypothetical protein
MRTLLPFGFALAALTSGCALSIPETPPYAPTQADSLPGASLCSQTETAARSLASAQAAGGWFLGSLGVASLGGGAITSLVNVQEGRRIIGVSLMLGGVALGAVAYTLFMRSKASGRLAQAANLAMIARDDHDAWAACLRAKGAWAGAKSSPDAITAEMLAEQDHENRKLREELDDLKKKHGVAPEPAKPALPPPLAPKR